MSKIVPHCVNLTRSDWSSSTETLRDEVQIVKRITGRFMSDMQKNCMSGPSSKIRLGKKLCNASAINLGHESRASVTWKVNSMKIMMSQRMFLPYVS
jgi:hypothetical protein